MPEGHAGDEHRGAPHTGVRRFVTLLQHVFGHRFAVEKGMAGRQDAVAGDVVTDNGDLSAKDRPDPIRSGRVL